MQIRDVEVTLLSNGESSPFAETYFQNCVFCDKTVRLTPLNGKTCSQLSGPAFFCPFCLRANHNHRSNRNVLIMSFRGVIGYLYYKKYDEDGTLFYNQISQMIDNHVMAGLQNPVFSYDPTTYLWFVDFNRVGRGKRKAPYEEVDRTFHHMLNAFSLEKIFYEKLKQEAGERFSKAIRQFYETRKRPRDKRMLIPTLQGLSVEKKVEYHDACRNFTKSDFILK